MNIEKEEENCFVVDYDIVKYKDKNVGKDENVEDLEDYEKIIRIYSVIDGSLITYNMRLENEPNLLIEKFITHILNLVQETWIGYENFSLLVGNIKALFTCSVARKEMDSFISQFENEIS
nr:345_t:CDS:2 [Entrophospora candida]